MKVLANAILFVMLGAAAFQPGIFHLKVETTRFFGTGFFGTGFLGLEARLFADTRSFRLQAEDPDALYKQRENIPLAQRAEQIWAGRLAKDAKDFESA